MIEIIVRKVKDSAIKIVDEIEPGCWINLTSPTPEEIEKISSIAKVPKDILVDTIDVNEMPLIDKEDDFTLIIIRVPHKDENGKFITMPLGVIIKENMVITSCIYRSEVIEYFIQGKSKDFYTTKKTLFLLKIFSRANHYYIKYLNEIYKEIERTEASLKKLKPDDIMYIVELEKAIIYFNTSVVPNANVLEKVMTGKIIRLYKEDQDILEDIIIDNRQTIEMTNVYSKILANIREAYSSVIANNLNKILKFLTAATVILTIPVIIAGLYGMNVGLPLQAETHAFLIILIFITIFSIIVAITFRKKDWI